jgi:cell wall-associated NlpC family hydrolase
MLYTKDRERIIAEAAEWLHTPYRGWSRCKHYGADCLGFVAGVFVNMGHITEKEATAAIPTDYSLQIGQHQEDTEYLSGIMTFMDEIKEHEARAGDVVMFKIAMAYTHSAIIVKWPLVIHCLAHGGVRYADAKRCPVLVGKAARFFTLKDGR